MSRTTELGKWVNFELTKLLGIDSSSVEDITSYLISITNEEELSEFVIELLSGNNEGKLNSPQREFLRELIVRWKRVLVPENVTVYRKDDDENLSKKQTAHKSIKGNQSSKNPFDMSSVAQNLDEISPGKKSKKRTSYVSLYGKDGEMKTNTVMLPGRNSCECQAQKHKLINNCLSCGRVVCEQEGSGPCLFCGALVCTREEKEMIARNTKKSHKLHDRLVQIPGGSALTKADTNESVAKALEKARAYKERLLNYDRTCAQRTRVIDDESDYYSTESNMWLSEKERKLLKQKKEEIWEMRHGSRLNRKVTLDFAGRRVIEDNYVNYDATEDADVMAANFGGDFSESFDGKQASDEINFSESFPGLVNPNIKGHVPTFIATEVDHRGDVAENVWSKPNNRLQDKQLLEMSDPGMCLSMHQPWASLLVSGIKRDEGRSWYSSHRGRLWIAAAAKQPTKDEISAVEAQHRHYWESIHQINDMPNFPKEYPVGCLLGCVDVKEVLSQDEYAQAYPLGDSVAAFVFVCENPHELTLKFPVKGKHKIWKIEPKLHKSAKGGLMF